MHAMGLIFFKCCSLFGFTDKGYRGPVSRLFMGRELLSDSGMRNYPPTPMTNSNRVRLLDRQTAHKK